LPAHLGAQCVGGLYAFGPSERKDMPARFGPSNVLCAVCYTCAQVPTTAWFLSFFKKKWLEDNELKKVAKRMAF
jgi:hypothetical protein